MEAKNSNFKTLIEGSKVFVVPLYQRRYSWVKKNWRDLWQDILEQYDMALDDSLVDGSNESPITHFIGSFVLAPVPGDAEYTRLVVVDGQQRLTTIMILLAAVRDTIAGEAHSAGARATAERKYNSLYLQNEFAEQQSNRLRLLPTQQDRADYAYTVGETPSVPSGQMGDAYDFFVSPAVLGGPDLRGEKLNLAKITEVILTRLTLVEIRTQIGDNVHQIFQTLNSAGVKLKQVDLLRNHFFMLLPSRGESLYGEVWREMELRLGESGLDRFFWADLVRRDARVTRTDVYSAMQRRLEPIARNEQAVEDALRGFSENSRSYQDLVAGIGPTPEVTAALGFLNHWGADTAQPVMLELLVRLRSEKLSTQEVSDGLRVIESFLVRRMLCGIPTNNLNRTFTSMARAMAAPAFGSADLASYLAGDRKYWPSNPQLLDSLLNRAFDLNGRSFQRQMVLEKLLGLYESFDTAELTVVQIAPADADGTWLSVFGDDGEGPEALHAQLVGTLGNLTLVRADAASTLSTDLHERVAQIADARHPWNEAIGSGSWNAGAIRNRAGSLIAAAFEIWRAPEGARSDYEVLAATELEALVGAVPHDANVALTDLMEVLGRSEAFVRTSLADLSPRLASRVVDDAVERSAAVGTLGKGELLKLARERDV